ncbi:GPI transamidase component [Tulasnella sp. 331]|nr:GPI transamidase component [Tulasnella sp. 331]
MNAPDPANASEVLVPEGAPPPPSFQSGRIRKWIVVSYWIVLALGIPFWWYTTSIQRLGLPRTRIQGLYELEETFKFPTDIILDTSGTSLDTDAYIGDLDVALRKGNVLNHTLNWKIHPLGMIFDRDGDHPKSANWQAEAGSEYHVKWSPSLPRPEVFERDLLISSPDEAPKGSASQANELAQLIEGLLVPSSADAYKLRVVQYAPRYRLAFSLLNEDASAGGGIMGWDVERAIERYLQPTLHQLGVLHNFTIESQVQFHAPLAFDPESLVSPKEGYVVDEDQMKIFVNSAEWTLASGTSNDRVLHFIIFVPAATHRPLRVVSPGGGLSRTNAFVIPQWGSIIVHNPKTVVDGATPQSYLGASSLADHFALFDTQLRALLGVQPLSAGVVSVPSPHTMGPISQWQMDALLRHRVIENVHGSIDTVNSIVKLVDRIEGMPVGDSVKSDVECTLNALEEVQEISRTGGSLAAMLQASAKASVHSSKAFFNPDMVAMLYFPAEHKYAVYAPLFAPVTIPLVITAIQELRSWLKNRQLGRSKVE